MYKKTLNEYMDDAVDWRLPRFPEVIPQRIEKKAAEESDPL